jgi:hypothetical protein
MKLYGNTILRMWDPGALNDGNDIFREKTHRLHRDFLSRLVLIRSRKRAVSSRAITSGATARLLRPATPTFCLGSLTEGR